jgi:hypothetical protein
MRPSPCSDRSGIPLRAAPRRRPTRRRRRPAAALVALAIALSGASAAAQDWGDPTEDDWTQPAAPASDDGPLSGWSLRAGVGFIDDPTAFLLNVEVPYRFDRWVSAGPMFQIGLDDNNTVVAPTLDVALHVPDMPGEAFDAVSPYAFVGVGFAWIEDDNRRNDDSSAGFLVNFGFGVELEVTPHFFLGSHMSFNFLPERTLGQDFFYAWQIGGARIAF